MQVLWKNTRKTENKMYGFWEKLHKVWKSKPLCCYLQEQSELQQKDKKVQAVAGQDSDSCEDRMTAPVVTKEMESVNQVKDMKITQKDTQQLFSGMMISNNLVNFQIDCGATYARRLNKQIKC